jgi:hypothetical protein
MITNDQDRELVAHLENAGGRHCCHIHDLRGSRDHGLVGRRRAMNQPKVKHWVRLLIAEFPSRGGNGAPLAWLFTFGVLLSNMWLIEASVGSANTGCSTAGARRRAAPR